MSKLTIVYVPTINPTTLAVIQGNRVEDLVEKGKAYVHTPEELLALRKKWAAEDWDAAFKKAGENMIDHIVEIPNPAPDKEQYINNLKID